MLRRVFYWEFKVSTGQLLPARDHAPLPAGQVRDVDYHHVTRCDNCPHGRFREDEGGRFMESCVKCEPGRFNVNVGSASKFDCLRCPPGQLRERAGHEAVQVHESI